MVRKMQIATLLLLFNIANLSAFNDLSTPIQYDNDTSRIAELNEYWDQLSQTVREGDFEGYGLLYHPDAVVVFAVGENKSSVSIAKALSDWKQGFEDTKAGKANSNVVFRLSQRINNENTAHETGIFHYTSLDNDGQATASSYVHFEMLMVKKEGQWLGVMEYQKSIATEAEWEELAPLK